MELIQTTKLSYQDWKSDKVYNVELIKSLHSNNWNVQFAYGRRNTTLKTGIKNTNALSYNQARKLFNDLVYSKEKKGYSVVSKNQNDYERQKFYSSFAMTLVNTGVLNETEYKRIAGMLNSCDPESIKLAEVLIETKELQRWEQN